MNLTKNVSKKALCCLVVILVLLTQFSFAAEAPYVYVSLGDSIPNGVSYEYTLKGSIIDSYTDKLARDIDARPEYAVTYHDLSKSGGKAIDVYNQVMNSANYSAIASADLITLCIGANDLMDAARRTWLGTIDFYSIDWKKADAGRLAFETNWPKIIQQIKTINPDVKLVVMNIYNPYNKTDKRTVSGVHIRNTVDTYMNGTLASKLGLNTIIKSGAITFNYTVVDIYKLFEEKYGSTKQNVTGFYGLIVKDPHPDKNGQTEIFNLHKLATLY